MKTFKKLIGYLIFILLFALFMYQAYDEGGIKTVVAIIFLTVFILGLIYLAVKLILD